MTRNYVQGKDYRLAGSGVAATDTSLVLTSMQLPNSGELVTMSMFGSIGFITFEPETDREENASFTGITQNANGTATLTGVTRGLTFVSPSTTDITLRKSHSGGTIVRVSNSVQFYENLANKYNQETIKGVWTFNSSTDGAAPKVDDDAYVPADDEYIHKKFAQDNYGSGNVAVAVDGVTITGDGTTGNPLVATPGAYSLDVQENAVSIETGVDTINFTGNVNVTNPSAGVVDVEILSGGGSFVEITGMTAGEQILGSTTTPQACFIGDDTSSYVSGTTTVQSQSPGNDIDFATEKVAIKITVSERQAVNSVRFAAVRASGSGDYEVSIQSDTAGSPSGTKLATSTGNLTSGITTSSGGAALSVNLSTTTELVSATDYWVVFETTSGSGSWYLKYAGSADGGLGSYQTDNGGGWTAGTSGRYVQCSVGVTYTSPLIWRSDANVTNRNKFDLIVPADYSIDDTITSANRMGEQTGFTGLTPGAEYGLSNTRGNITTGASVIVGIALSTTKILVDRYNGLI